MGNNLLIIALLVVIAAASKAIQDKISFHFYTSDFSSWGDWWNPAVSWKFKWKPEPLLAGKLVERFPGSSTVFAFTSDAWHFFQMVEASCWQFSISFLLFPLWWQILLSFLAIKVLHNFGFELLFRKVFHQPEKT
jgi:hypothetical protein